jgi:serine/threonine kinase 38
MNWDTLRKLKAPYQPSVTSEISTENFDKFDEEEPFFGADGKNGKKPTTSRKIDMNFIGYTYKADVENEKSMLVNVLKDLETISET